MAHGILPRPFGIGGILGKVTYKIYLDRIRKQLRTLGIRQETSSSVLGDSRV